MQPAVHHIPDQKSIILAEPERIISKALVALIERNPHYKIIKECRDAEEVVKHVVELEPDVLITGIHLDEKNGAEAIRSLRKERKSIKIVVLGSYRDVMTIRMVLDAGADAYISRGDDPEELFTALNKTLSGKRYVPSSYSQILINLKDAYSSSLEAKDFDPLGELSNREREVFYMLANGKPNRLIAKQLYISPRTVETHRARVIKKLGFTSTADLIKYAIRNNLTSCT